MKLVVRDQEGALVAEVVVDPGAAADPDPVHVIGRFSPGPAFERVKSMIDAFRTAYAAGDLPGAARLHERIDALGLIATGEDGVRYQVFNVHFEDGGLLFSVSKWESAG